MYVVTVLAMRVLLDPLAGTSDLAVAVSTLAVAALFGPVRARIQQVVDRRFYRRKYDAARTVESFAGRLRTRSTSTPSAATWRRSSARRCSPAHVSLWLRGSP